MICSKCSNEIEDDSLFCSICGSDLRIEVKQTPVVNDEYPMDTVQQDENEAKQIPLISINSTSKINLAQISIFIAIIGCILFFVSAQQISKVGDDMITLQSQSGTSLAEVYYQDIGKALKGFAMFARALGVSVLAITIGFSFKEHKVVS